MIEQKMSIAEMIILWWIVKIKCEMSICIGDIVYKPNDK